MSECFFFESERKLSIFTGLCTETYIHRKTLWASDLKSRMKGKTIGGGRKKKKPYLFMPYTVVSTFDTVF